MTQNFPRQPDCDTIPSQRAWERPGDKPMTDTLIYQCDASVWIEHGEKHEKLDKLDAVIDKSGFFANLEETWEATGGTKDDFSIVIKPNIMTA